MNGHLNYHQLFYYIVNMERLLILGQNCLNFCQNWAYCSAIKKFKLQSSSSLLDLCWKLRKKHCLYVLINSLTFISVLILHRNYVLNSIYRLQFHHLQPFYKQLFRDNCVFKTIIFNEYVSEYYLFIFLSSRNNRNSPETLWESPICLYSHGYDHIQRLVTIHFHFPYLSVFTPYKEADL